VKVKEWLDTQGVDKLRSEHEITFDYAGACERAAEEQGVAEISRALSEAGIDNTIEQTGGFIMCVFVYDNKQKSYLLVTDGVICFYPNPNDEDKWEDFEQLEFFEEDVTVSDMVAAVRKHLGKVGK
jgi:hypothetical protein